jgi:hypothetical protein
MPPGAQGSDMSTPNSPTRIRRRWFDRHTPKESGSARGWTSRTDTRLHVLFVIAVVVVLFRSWSCGGSPATVRLWTHHQSTGELTMNHNLTRITYQGFRTGDGWEVAVARPGQPLRLLDLPRRQGELALVLLTDYLGDQTRAADLYQDFASLTIDRFTVDWELSGSDIENAIMDVEILRARWRMAITRG